MTVECIPRRPTFKNGYLGLFWASYIRKPESGAIRFLGHPDRDGDRPRGVEARTPRTASSPRTSGPTTAATSSTTRISPDAGVQPVDLPVRRALVLRRQPGMAYVQVFRPADRVRISQSPDGGGKENPAWDFQYLFPDVQVGRCYRMVMRALYLPYESPEQVRRAVEPHRRALE
ncbi:MAG: hypothetical protein U0835_27165 [Isosphaeraceae bacterium]